MPQQESAPCFIVVGIVMIVFDIILIESTYMAVFGGFFLFLGILIAIIENNAKQKALRGKTNQPHSTAPQQQHPTLPIQNVPIVKESPRQHKFCPYCGRETSLEICPDCGKDVD